MKAPTNLQPDTSKIDLVEMIRSTPKGLRRPTPTTEAGKVALAAALVSTLLLYDGDVKVILVRRLGCSPAAAERYLQQAHEIVWGKPLGEQRERLLAHADARQAARRPEPPGPAA